MLISCRKEDISDFQILQNDILRICNLSRISDRVSIKELHAKCKIIAVNLDIFTQLNFRASSPMEHIRAF